MRLITIVTEASLEDQLCRDLTELGASGYTVSNARGRGSRGVRDAGWSSSGNVRIEVICNPALAERIFERLAQRYFDHYAMVAFETEARVMRPAKFGSD